VRAASSVHRALVQGSVVVVLVDTDIMVVVVVVVVDVVVVVGWFETKTTDADIVERNMNGVPKTGVRGPPGPTAKADTDPTSAPVGAETDPTATS